MISISNLSMQFSGRYLFDSVSLTIPPRDKIGLIGRNGAGKSTLLKIIYGRIVPETGRVAIPKEYKTGYLPQEIHFNSDKSIFAETASALEEIRSIEKKLSEISEDISQRTDYESDSYSNQLQKMAELNDRYELLGGSESEARVERILLGLGFDRDRLHEPASNLSGGWQMRIELAKILLSSPDIILLDEPTNHLDIDSVRWLEQFLKNYFGSVILVSHDRRFLDTVTFRTIEISLGKIYDQKLPYTKFVEFRKQEREQLQAAAKNQQRKIAQTERFIERFRYKNTLATRVQSKIKQLEKMDRIEVEDEDLSKIKISFPSPPRSGRVVFEAKGLSKNFGDNQVLSNIDLAVERGEKIAFLGKNGMGKTTMAKIIAGDESADGDYSLGHNVELAYFAQHVTDMLNPELTVFETIDTAAQGEVRNQMRSILGAFLFSGDDVDKKVKALSGGEKSRLAIAKLLLEPSNFLIMDEPTNHLDMISKDVLKRALIEYGGAMIIVSHDREFLEGLTEKSVFFNNRKIIDFPGSINEFLEKHQIEELDKPTEMRTKKPQSQKKSNEKSDAQLHRQQTKERQKIENRLKKQISECEENIMNFEEKIAEIDETFADPAIFDDQEKYRILQDEYDKLKESLEAEMVKWTQLGEELESV